MIYFLKLLAMMILPCALSGCVQDSINIPAPDQTEENEFAQTFWRMASLSDQLGELTKNANEFLWDIYRGKPTESTRTNQVELFHGTIVKLLGAWLSDSTYPAVEVMQSWTDINTPTTSVTQQWPHIFAVILASIGHFERPINPSYITRDLKKRFKKSSFPTTSIDWVALTNAFEQCDSLEELRLVLREIDLSFFDRKKEKEDGPRTPYSDARYAVSLVSDKIIFSQKLTRQIVQRADLVAGNMRRTRIDQAKIDGKGVSLAQWMNTTKKAIDKARIIIEKNTLLDKKPDIDIKNRVVTDILKAMLLSAEDKLNIINTIKSTNDHNVWLGVIRDSEMRAQLRYKELTSYQGFAAPQRKKLIDVNPL